MSVKINDTKNVIISKSRYSYFSYKFKPLLISSYIQKVNILKNQSLMNLTTTGIKIDFYSLP